MSASIAGGRELAQTVINNRSERHFKLFSACGSSASLWHAEVFIGGFWGFSSDELNYQNQGQKKPKKGSNRLEPIIRVLTSVLTDNNYCPKPQYPLRDK